MLFDDDDDGVDEEADLELQTLLFASEEGHLLALLVTETAAFPAPRRPPTRREGERPREDDMDGMSKIARCFTAVVSRGVFMRSKRVAVYPKEKFIHFLMKKSRI